MRGLVWLTMAALVLTLGGGRTGMAQPDGADTEPAAESHEEHAAGEHGPHGHHELGHGNATAALEDPAEFRTDLAIYTFIVFLVLLAILSMAAWPKISTALAEREKRIEAAIADALAKQEEGKRLLAEHEAKLASAAGEVRAMLEEARRDAEATREQIVADARVAAAHERDRAVREIDAASAQAMKNIAETSANMAVELAGKVIRESVNPAKQQELVRAALAQMNASSPSNN
jgi:F-type H+-transporting ATPase subunit b